MGQAWECSIHSLPLIQELSSCSQQDGNWAWFCWPVSLPCVLSDPRFFFFSFNRQTAPLLKFLSFHIFPSSTVSLSSRKHVKIFPPPALIFSLRELFFFFFPRPVLYSGSGVLKPSERSNRNEGPNLSLANVWCLPLLQPGSHWIL